MQSSRYEAAYSVPGNNPGCLIVPGDCLPRGWDPSQRDELRWIAALRNRLERVPRSGQLLKLLSQQGNIDSH